MSMAGRLGLTAWRRRNTLLGAVAGVALVLLCFQYSALPARPAPVANVELQPQSPQRALHYLPRIPPPLQFQGNRLEDGVRFLSPLQRGEVTRPQRRSDVEPPAVVEQVDEDHARMLAQGDSPSRDDVEHARMTKPRLTPVDSVLLHQANAFDFSVGETSSRTRPLPDAAFYRNLSVAQQLEQMGVARVALDPHNPLVPRHRLVHLDLKGAPPRMTYLKRLLPIFKQLGATGLLLEWEDMFPFTGSLARVAATNHYTPAEVRSLLVQAKELGLEVVPLVQTFGHLEFVLKLEPFTRLREVPDIPQALCPSLNDSLFLVGKMVEQVVAAHADVAAPRYIHIGCDEVFTMGECARCRSQPRDDLFLNHVARVARLVRERHHATALIWDDMLRHVPAAAMQEFGLGELVEPMVWVYAENVYRFVLPAVWDKYALVFPRVWTASAFKGAFGETLYVPNVKRHLENNLRWLEVMTNENSKFRDGFAGIALTGWQRYDHFAVLCELLPPAIPSLALALAATSHGYFNTSLRPTIHAALHCPPARSAQPVAFLNLNTDPYLWERFSSCGFPGVAAFRLTSRLDVAERDVEEFLMTATRKRGWLTDYNVRNNFTTPLRIDELMADHSRLLHVMLSLARAAKEALIEAFDAHTVGEWVEQRILPYVKRLERLQRDVDILREQKIWPARPLPLDPALRRLGFEVPVVEEPSPTSPPANAAPG